MLNVNSCCTATDNLTLKELTCYQHFLFRDIYVNAMRETRFFLSLPPLLNCCYHTILIFVPNVTEINLRIEPRPVLVQRCVAFNDRINRRDVVVVRASTSQLVDLGFISIVEEYQKTLKNGIHSFPAWRSAHKG